MASSREKLVIGTRGSKLALWQSEYIKGLVEGITGLPVELKIIKTTGDKILDVPLAKVGGKGLFTKELEVELLAETVDLCVHSMKDVPTELPEGLYISATPARVDPRDALVSGAGYSLDTLPQGARVGTSSLRRVAQVRALRPDVEIVDVRGNLDTRMRKAETGEVDVVILASAGITRMGWADRITGYIPTEQMVSAVGQGAIGIEIRENDEFMRDVCAKICDADTFTCVTSERVVMKQLDGGCQVPIGAYARLDGRYARDGCDRGLRRRVDDSAPPPRRPRERSGRSRREDGRRAQGDGCRSDPQGDTCLERRRPAGDLDGEHPIVTTDPPDNTAVPTGAPLSGRSVIVTRTLAQAHTLVEPLEALGAEVLAFPVLETVDPEDWAPLDAAIANLATYDWVVLTSTNGVDRFLKRFRAVTGPRDAILGTRFAAVGSATAKKLAKHGLPPALVPEDFRAEGLRRGVSRDGGRTRVPRAHPSCRGGPRDSP